MLDLMMTSKSIMTHGNDMILYNSPIREPTSLTSDIWAMHGTISALKAPEKNPYSAANIMREGRERAYAQKTSDERPARNAHGMRRAKRPMESASRGGARRPATLPALSIANM